MENYRLVKIVLAVAGATISACSSVSSSQEKGAAAPTQTEDYMPEVDTSKQIAKSVGSGTLDIKGNSSYGDPGEQGGGQFRVQCGYSHMSNDDPIVYPNQEGAAHHHTFLGNTTTNYKTDPMTLSEVGDSTCFGGIANRSAYWVPSLIDTRTNAPLKPKWALFYYKTSRPDIVVAPPKGLRIIAGSASAKSAQVGWAEINRWGCKGRPYAGRQQSILPCETELTNMVVFPSCWDGINLDSPNHQSHMAYSHNGVCPRSHPKQIPDITMNIHYDMTGIDSTKLRLASDNYRGGPGGYSSHADWINGWNEDVLNTIIKNCLKARKDCHANLLGNGQQLYDKFGKWDGGTISEALKK